MNIGVDLDGVVFDTESLFRVISQIENVKLGRNIVDKEQLRLQKRYDWSQKQIDDFMSKNMLKVYKIAPIMPYSKQIIMALSKKNKVYAITSRGLIDKKEITVSNKRLKQEGLEFEQVIYSVSNKLEVCQDLGIDLMIEDLYDTAITLAENGVQCLYYRDLVLKQCDHPYVTEVRDWGDIGAELVKRGLISVKDIIK